MACRCRVRDAACIATSELQHVSAFLVRALADTPYLRQGALNFGSLPVDRSFRPRACKRRQRWGAVHVVPMFWPLGSLSDDSQKIVSPYRRRWEPNAATVH